MNSLSPEAFRQLLQEHLQAPRSYRRYRERFAPELSFGRHHGPSPEDARRAAVLILFYPHQGEWKLPLTLRPDTLPDHPGQICFPGGAREPEETDAACALREMSEELGVFVDSRHLLETLPPIYVYNSHFLVQPIVAVVPDRPSFLPNSAEVAEVLEVPALDLLDESRYGEHRVQRQRLSFLAPHIEFERHRIWGATCMILGELIGVLHSMKGSQS